MSKISVIIPAYNAAETINDCLTAVSKQKDVDLELIVINDGSTDDTVAKITAFSASAPFPVKLHSIVNCGPAGARNAGIALADGEYICFIDADDTIEPEMLKIMLQEAENSGAEWVIADFNLIAGEENRRQNVFMGEKDTLYKADELPVVIANYLDTPRGASFFTNIWGKLYKTSIIKKQNIKFDTSLQTWEDTVFNCNYVSEISSIKYIRKHLYNYQVNPGQNSTGGKLFLQPFGHRKVTDVLKRSLNKYHWENDKINALIQRAEAYFIVKNLLVAAALVRDKKNSAAELTGLINTYTGDRNTVGLLSDYRWRKGESLLIPLLLRLKLKKMLFSICMRKVGK